MKPIPILGGHDHKPNARGEEEMVLSTNCAKVYLQMTSDRGGLATIVTVVNLWKTPCGESAGIDTGRIFWVVRDR